MLAVIREVPLEALRINGESCVEKIRQVGASLLEIIHGTDDPDIRGCAKSVFQALLDTLA